jgi:hypothetical protein
MLRPPESVQLRPYWQYAGELMLKAAEQSLVTTIVTSPDWSI